MQLLPSLSLLLISLLPSLLGPISGHPFLLPSRSCPSWSSFHLSYDPSRACVLVRNRNQNPIPTPYPSGIQYDAAPFWWAFGRIQGLCYHSALGIRSPICSSCAYLARYCKRLVLATKCFFLEICL